MLGVNQLDFINYCNALKGNYRKGVHKMETLLENPTHAKEFASNLGGVSVVLGTPVGKEDRNSETLRSMLLASDVANDAVYTWMGQYYEFDSWDELLGDEDRCKAMMANELLWRALSASGVAMGKTVATLAGLSCSAYDDMSAVAASSTAMAAVASSQTARAAIEKSQVAKDAIAASDMATAKYAVGAAGLKPADYANMAAVAASQTAMTAIASSQTAMAAIFRSSTAMTAVQNNASAWAIFSNASSAVMGKTVAELAGLNPSGYADMNAIASSSTAMAAVASSQTARAAIEKSQVAKDAIAASDMATAKYAVGAAGLKPADYANMAAVAASQTAMTAIASSQTAMTAVCSSALAFNAALKNSTARTQLAGSSYLQSNYDKLLSTVGNSTYFSQKFDNIDSGAKRAISGGNTDTTATANESVFLCKKIGAWSNGNSVTGTVAHLQTKTTAGSISTRAGGGQSTDDYTTGGVQAKYICIGGCTFTENGDAYCCGIFAFAK